MCGTHADVDASSSKKWWFPEAWVNTTFLELHNLNQLCSVLPRLLLWAVTQRAMETLQEASLFIFPSHNPRNTHPRSDPIVGSSPSLQCAGDTLRDNRPISTCVLPPYPWRGSPDGMVLQPSPLMSSRKALVVAQREITTTMSPACKNRCLLFVCLKVCWGLVGQSAPAFREFQVFSPTSRVMDSTDKRWLDFSGLLSFNRVHDGNSH